MLSVFEREIRCLFRSIKAIICMSAFTLGIGIAFTVSILNSGYGKVDPVFSIATILACAFIPLISSLAITRERREGTDLYLSAMPFTNCQIIFGKLLAHLAFFMIPLAAAGLCPFVLSLCGASVRVNAYIAYAMLLVFCAFVISLCVMISSFFYKAWKAVLSAYLVVVSLFLIGTFSSLLMHSALVGLIFFAILSLVVGVLVYLASRSWLLAGAVAGVGAAISAILYFVFPLSLENAIRELVCILSPFKQYNYSVIGIFDISSFVFFASCIAFFIWMSCIFLYRKKKIKGMKRAPINMKKAASITLVSVILLGVNVSAFALPASVRSLDITDDKLYGISSTTQNFISGLEEDVEIYLVNPGFMDEQVKNYIKKYSELSDKIILKEISSFKAVEFLTSYGETSATGTSCGILVQGGTRWSKISYNDLFYYYNETYGEMTPAQYGYYYTMCEKYINDTSLKAAEQQSMADMLDMLEYETDLFFKGEEILTAAIEYATVPYIPSVYVLSGHGEKFSTDISAKLLAYLNGGEAEEIKILDLAATTSFPEDIGLLVLDCPSADYTNEEVRLFAEYMNGGGRMLVITNEANHSMPNLMSLLAYYGLSAQEGVISKDGSTYISANANTTSATEMKINGASAIISADVGDIDTQNLLTVHVTENGETQEKSVAVLAYENSVPKLAWVTGGDTFSAQTNTMTDEEKEAYIVALSFISTVRTGIQKTFSSSAIVDNDKAYSADIIKYSNTAAAYVGVLFIAIIPLVAFGVPALKIYSRRKRSKAKKENN